MTENYMQLGKAVALQAIRDFFNANKNGKEKILKELRSDWMDWLTDGLSFEVANQLVTNPKGIKAKMDCGGIYNE